MYVRTSLVRDRTDRDELQKMKNEVKMVKMPVQFDNEDEKDQHSIHIILGAGDIAKIKSSGFIAGKPEEPVAEKTLFGWTLMGTGTETSKLTYFTTTSQDDYKTLYSLDVLGLED